MYIVMHKVKETKSCSTILPTLLHVHVYRPDDVGEPHKIAIHMYTHIYIVYVHVRTSTCIYIVCIVHVYITCTCTGCTCTCTCRCVHIPVGYRTVQVAVP